MTIRLSWRERVVKRLLGGVAVAVCTVAVCAVAVCAVAGCSPGVDPPPVSPPVVAPTSVAPRVSTPPPSPSSQWDEAEQGAIDAVQRYLEVWAEIGHDPGGTDWSLMNPVAIEPVMGTDREGWEKWLSNGWHLVGVPVFQVTDSSRGLTDSDGEHYHVRGCMQFDNLNLADDQGLPVYEDMGDVLMEFLALLKPTGQYFVSEKEIVEESC
jgi:hypothetical protein